MKHPFYSLLMWLAQPLLRRKLARRAVAEPGYGVAVEERFGHYSMPADSGRIWIHAVSLGETRAAAILLAELRRQVPGMRLLLTHGTATGRSEGAKLLQSGDVQVWQPWDTAGAVQRFLDYFKPAVGVLMETEIWPNLTQACAARGVPLALANARMNKKSHGRARRLGWLARPVFAQQGQEALPGVPVGRGVGILGGVAARRVDQHGFVGKPPVAVAGAADALDLVSAELIGEREAQAGVDQRGGLARAGRANEDVPRQLV